MPFRKRILRLIRPEKASAVPYQTVAAPNERHESVADAAPTPQSTDEPGARAERQLVLYKFDSCPYCRRVMRLVDQLELADSIEYRDTRTDPRWRSDLRQRTGRTQVPCLFIDGEAMFESADINDWLQRNYA